MDLTVFSSDTSENNLAINQRVAENRQAARAEETKRALLKNLRPWLGWCNENGHESLPANAATVERYLLYLADEHPILNRAKIEIRKGMKPSGIAQALWAVNAYHRMKGYIAPGESESVRLAMAGIRRRKRAPRKQQRPFTIDEIRRVPFPQNIHGLRDKALLLVGFAGCFRRSELVSLLIEDIEITQYGMRVLLRHSKTDQFGEGSWVDIVSAHHYPDACPVAALTAWLEAAQIRSGHIFRSVGRGATPSVRATLSAVSVDRIVKQAAASLGYDATLYGGHSLRAGKATYLSDHGKSPTLIARHGRWKSLDMVLQYCRGEVSSQLEGLY